MKNYDLSDLDKYNTLKPSGMMWLVLAFQARHVVLVLLVAFNVFVGLRRHGGDNPFHYLIMFGAGPQFLLASLLPSLLIGIALWRRTPEAAPIYRRIWKRGRDLLIFSVLLEIVLFVATYLHRAYEPTLFVVVTVLLDFYIVVYLSHSYRVADTFADFPAEKSSGAK